MSKQETLQTKEIPPFERILTYLSQVENPCSFDMEGYHVELEWMNTNITLQNRLGEIFASL